MGREFESPVTFTKSNNHPGVKRREGIVETHATSPFHYPSLLGSCRIPRWILEYNLLHQFQSELSLGWRKAPVYTKSFEWDYVIVIRDYIFNQILLNRKESGKSAKSALTATFFFFFAKKSIE